MDFEQIVRWYFAGEKAEAFWILAAGIASLVAALLLWFLGREPFARGLAPAQFVAEEGPRIAQVVQSFGLYRIGYAMAVALALCFVFVLGKPSQHGFAVGLLLLAALGLTIDFFAERRAEQYREALQAVGALPA